MLCNGSVVGDKQRLAFVVLRQLAEGSMRDRHLRAVSAQMILLDHIGGFTDPIKSGRPATELVEDDKTPRRALLQYQAGLDHLDHERRSTSGQFVRGCSSVSI